MLYRLPPDEPEPATVPVQIIGNYNVFETDCICESYKVGDNNILEAKGIKQFLLLKIFAKKIMNCSIKLYK